MYLVTAIEAPKNYGAAAQTPTTTRQPWLHRDAMQSSAGWLPNYGYLVTYLAVRLVCLHANEAGVCQPRPCFPAACFNWGLSPDVAGFPYR
jgi:hypothetical protein